MSRSPLRIVLANASMADYPQGGGHWAWLLQHLLGLDALGHDVCWLEIMRSTGHAGRNQRRLDLFFGRFGRLGFRDRCAVLLIDPNDESPTLDTAETFGRTKDQIRQLAGDADLLWNFSCAMRQPLLGLFRHRVLLDGDPGIVQVSALDWDMGIADHQTLFTAGLKMQDADCDVPALGATWHPFRPPIHLPAWRAEPDPGPDVPFTSATQWSWGELSLNRRVLSMSKRDAYLPYAGLPRRTGRPMELAVNIHPEDDSGDRELLEGQGWRLVHPHLVTRTPAAYQRYIRHSRAEFGCAKPIYRELKTGWFSDRSACYLASGRPVLAEDTGFSDHLPSGAGLLAFRNLDEAAEGVARIDADYRTHSRAARALAEEYLDARTCLQSMLTLCR